MNKNVPIYLAALLLVLAAGGFFYYSHLQSQQTAQTEMGDGMTSEAYGTSQDPNELLNPGMQTEAPAQENSEMSMGTDSPETTLAMQGTSTGSATVAGATQAKVVEENRNGCVRKFDAEKLKTDKVDAATNKFVTLDIKGMGKIKVELYAKDAPKTVENFLRLTNSGYYDCLTFHRISKGFVIQGGDPEGNGSGGFSAFGPTFEDELNTKSPSYQAGYVKGVLAMANRGANTNGSQFFIMTGDNTQLPHNYTIFGKVTTGIDVVTKIEAMDITPGDFGPTDGTPKKPVVITKAIISTK